MGNSGIGIFLLELGRITQDNRYTIYAEKIARWLQSHEPRIGRTLPLPGLYFGESGVGLFYFDLYKMTRDSNYLNLAKAQSDLVSTIPCTSADLLTGSAGVQNRAYFSAEPRRPRRKF